jgi:hypothetical protein
MSDRHYGHLLSDQDAATVALFERFDARTPEEMGPDWGHA